MILIENIISVQNNIFDVLDTVQLVEAPHVTKTECLNSETSPTEKTAISETDVFKNDNSINDNAKYQFFAPMTEPAKPALILPLSPSLKVQPKKVDDFNNNPDTAAKVDENDNVGPSIILSQSSEIKDPCVSDNNDSSQVELVTLQQTTNIIKNKGNIR